MRPVYLGAQRTTVPYTLGGCRSCAGLGATNVAAQSATTGVTTLLSIAAPFGLGILGAKLAGKGGATMGFLAGAVAGVFLMLRLTSQVAEGV